jgi:hypothetical protein
MKELQAQEQSLLDKEEIRKRILIEKQRSETFIREEQLIGAIEQALDNPHTYEYAIALDGRLRFDRKLHPYALQPNAIPETSSVTSEYTVFDDCDHFLEPKQSMH